MSGLSCSTVAEGALRTWDIVLENERGPADPIDAFKSGTRVGGDKMPTGECFLPVHLLGKGDEVANLADSALAGRRVERPPILRGTPSRAATEVSGVRCQPSRTSNLSPPHGQDGEAQATLAERTDVQAQQPYYFTARGWGGGP